MPATEKEKALISSILAAVALQASGLSVTVDRVWEENPSYTSHRLGNVMVTVTNNSRVSYDYVMVDCTFTRNNRPVDTVRVSIWNLGPNQRGTDDAVVWGIDPFDAAYCRIGPVARN